MLFAPAEKNISCVECLQISRELNDAYAEERRESDSRAWTKPIDKERLRASVEALRSMVGGTEEDAERADALLDAYYYRPQSYFAAVPPAALTAIRRSAQHAARTGHWLRRVARDV